MKKGFTLLEMMTASFIFTLVITTSVSFFIGINRMIQDGYAVSELAVSFRQMREKMLFHVMPVHGGKYYPGVLTGSPVSALPVEGGAKIYVETPVTKSDGSLETSANGEIAYSTIQLVPTATVDSGHRFNNDAQQGVPYRERWFSLGSLGYLDDDCFDDRLLSTQASVTKNLYFVKFTGKLGNVERSERVAVPVFGTDQVKNSTDLFHDNQ